MVKGFLGSLKTADLIFMENLLSLPFDSIPITMTPSTVQLCLE
jgi:hypothetical protein